MKRSGTGNTDDCGARLWWRLARWPLAAAVLGLAVFTTTHLDIAIAHRYFFVDGTWRAAHAWWANEFLHEGGRWAIRTVAIAALAIVIAGSFAARWRPYRRSAGYIVLAIVLSTGFAGLLKKATNVDCPWDLIEFGGKRPHVALFADRPDDLPRAGCFPSAHASSGYALLAFYFLWRGVPGQRRFVGLAMGLGTGVVFGLAQQSRGAHFVSHDVASAALVWLTCLTLYVYGFHCRLRSVEAL
jgi:membrane-associated PAP2 superfamily phosphatase